MKPKLTLQELIETVIQKMCEMDYSPNTFLLNCQRFYKRFSEYAENLDETYYSEELGAKYLKEKYKCTHDTIHKTHPQKLYAHRSVI